MGAGPKHGLPNLGKAKGSDRALDRIDGEGTRCGPNAGQQNRALGEGRTEDSGRGGGISSGKQKEVPDPSAGDGRVRNRQRGSLPGCGPSLRLLFGGGDRPGGTSCTQER